MRLSTSGTLDDDVAVWEAGTGDHVAWPIDADELPAVVRRHLSPMRSAGSG